MKIRMNIWEKLNMILPVLSLLALLLTVFPTNAYADILDADVRGSITMTMRDTNGNPVGGGEIEIFYVAEVTFDRAQNPHYEYMPEFKNRIDRDLNELTESEAAFVLREDVEENDIQPLSTIEIDDSGIIVISDLPVGVYLIVQTKAAEGYNSIGEFIVTIPLEEGETLIYDVDATPKIRQLYKNSNTEDDPDTEIETEPVTESESEPESESESEPVSESEPESESNSEPVSESESEPVSESESEPESESESEAVSEPEPEMENESESESETENETGSEPPEANPPSSDGGTPIIPQTGLILWPIQAAAGAGLVLMIIGWVLVSPSAFTKGRNTDKTKHV